MPSCSPCLKKGLECPGYLRPIRWSIKHDSTASKSKKPIRRANEDARNNREDKSLWRTNQSEFTLAAKTSLSVSSEQSPVSDNGGMMSWENDKQTDAFTNGGSAPLVCACDAGFEHLNRLSHPPVERSQSWASGSQDQDSCVGFGSNNTVDMSIGDLDVEQFWNIDKAALDFLLDEVQSTTLTTTPLAVMPDDQDITLSNHYFSLVCCINSCFDSLRNPFRSYIGDIMLSCPLIFHCVMAMSAAHLFQKKKEMMHVVQKHRNEALSCLLQEASPKTSSVVKSEMVLGNILLGMTSSWHEPSSLGLTHLRSARELFKKWLTGIQRVEMTQMDIFSRRNKSFLVGIMAYWEALASFLSDQEPDMLSYLSEFCHHGSDEIIYPNPWTGISTPIFIYLGQVGALSRQHRLIHNLSIYLPSDAIAHEVYSKQFEEAAKLESNILQYHPPERDHIEDHCDELTPLRHLRSLSHIYRFAALLQLYMTFPDLLAKDIPVVANSTSPRSIKVEPENGSSIVALAASILNIIASIPETARVNALLTLPLLIAGSALQTCRHYGATGQTSHSKGRIDSQHSIKEEMLSLHSERPMILYWRSFAQQRMKSLHEYVGLEPIIFAIKILEAVWMKADLVASDQSSAEDSIPAFKMVHWMDVMVEERLESIFG